MSELNMREKAELSDLHYEMLQDMRERAEKAEAERDELRKHSEFLEWQIANMDAFMTFKYPDIAGILETACGAREVLEKCKEIRLQEVKDDD